MNQQPDKFFREKLAGYQQPVPASAWKKIAAATKRESKHIGWMKVAASLLLISIAAYLLWPQKGNVQLDQNTLAEIDKSPAPAISTPQELQPPKAVPQDDQLQQKDVTSTKNVNEATRPRKHTVKNTTPQPDVTQHAAEANISTTASPDAPESVSTDDSSETILLEPAYTIAQETPATAPQNITLTYTAEDVNKYLDKKSMAQATSEEKKPSTLMKLLQKANDLKNNQDPMGELRQKKNEILALNFKNEKQRGQNK